MAKFAPVAPWQLLRSIRDQYGPEVLGHYHLVLAHDIVAHKDKWRDLLPPGSTVIIDNSIIELGYCVSAEIMIEAYNIIGDKHHRVIVLPEVVYDPLATLNVATTFYIQLQNIGSLQDPVDMMIVVQGKDAYTLKTFFDCVRHYLPHMNNNVSKWWLGIPRTLTQEMGTRAYTCYEALKLKLEFPDLKIHLLGFSDNLPDDIFCCNLFGIEGIDSTVPLRVGQQAKDLDLRQIRDQAGPRGSFWEDPHTHVYHTTVHNISHYRSAITRDPYSIVGLYPQLKQKGNI